MLGSPPLAREPLLTGAWDALKGRITPARAGTTQRNKTAQDEVWDHPRSRGNHPILRKTDGFMAGSPPLAREPLRVDRRDFEREGITPARAGTTSYQGRSKEAAEDHPRSRGNHQTMTTTQGEKVGSPPLAREPHISGGSSGRERGITPARAGTTHSSRKQLVFGWDHPRSRGNHAPILALIRVAEGSPPLAREPPTTSPGRRPWSGITPARAGTTSFPHEGRRHRRDHPRSRGNHAISLNTAWAESGSPPLAREPPLFSSALS